MEKYSYYFYARTDHSRIMNGQVQYRMVNATGFFIRQNKSLYFVSAGHSLFPMQHVGQPPLSYTYPKKFKLRMFQVKTGLREEFQLDVSSITPSENYLVDHPDVYCVKVDIPKTLNVNSIESFIAKNDNELRQATEAIMYGYPGGAAFDENPNASKSVFKVDTYFDKLIFTEHTNENLIGLKPMQGHLEPGLSGAPMFLLLPKGKMVFGGMCIGIHNGQAAFVRIQSHLPCGIGLGHS